MIMSEQQQETSSDNENKEEETVKREKFYNSLSTPNKKLFNIVSTEGTQERFLKTKDEFLERRG